MRTLEELLAAEADYLEAIDGGEECYWDTMAEHKGEVARFGDSWPGAQVQLAQMLRGIEASKTCLAMVRRELDERFPMVDEPSIECRAPISPNGLWDCECNECQRLQREAEEDLF